MAVTGGAVGTPPRKGGTIQCVLWKSRAPVRGHRSEIHPKVLRRFYSNHALRQKSSSISRRRPRPEFSLTHHIEKFNACNEHAS